MKVYVTRENPRLNCPLDDATLLDIARLLNAKANLGSVTTETDQDLAGHKENVIAITEGFPHWFTMYHKTKWPKSFS